MPVLSTMQSQSLSHSDIDFESLIVPFVQSLAVETALRAQKSLLSLLFMIGSLPNSITSMDIIAKDQSFPVAELFKVKEPVEENKDASETEENDYSEDDEDDHDVDEDDDNSEGSDDEESDSDDDDSDIDKDGSSDDDEDDDGDDDDGDDEDSDDSDDEDEDEDEDEDDQPQPPSKRKK